MGSQGDQVRILQNRLIYLGYLSGTADGVFAETTEAAVVSFQSRNSLTSDGVAGPDTLEKLYSTSARKASAVVAYPGLASPGHEWRRRTRPAIPPEDDELLQRIG